MKDVNDPVMINRWMIGRIGYDDWVVFCKLFGGQKWWIPHSPAKRDRDRQIREDFENIMTSATGAKMEAVFKSLSRKYGLSERWIRHIIFSRKKRKKVK